METYIYLKGKETNNKLKFGLTADSLSEELINGVVRKNINDNETCEATITLPTYKCPPNITKKYETLFQVGLPITSADMKVGTYVFTNNNPGNPAALDLSNDIATNSENYRDYPYSQGGTIVFMINGLVHYHVIRCSLSQTLTITDAAGENVTSAFTQLTDSGYRYYLLKKVVAPNVEITYTIR